MISWCITFDTVKSFCEKCLVHWLWARKFFPHVQMAKGWRARYLPDMAKTGNFHGVFITDVYAKQSVSDR